MKLRARRRLPGLVLAAGIVYLVAINSLVIWLYLVCALLLAIVPIGIAGPMLAVRERRLRFQSSSGTGFASPLTQDRGRIFAGDQIRLRCEGNVDLDRCQLGPIRLVDGSLWDVDAQPGRDDAVILSGSRARRGLIALESIRVASRWPLGIVEAEAWVPLRLNLTVHPRYVAPRARAQSLELTGVEEARRRGYGEDFVGVREYRVGDSHRHVHWRATARMGQLMVLETAAPAASTARFHLVLELGAEVEAQDRAVSAVASLAAACVRSGRPFSITGLGGALRQWTEALPALARTAPPTQDEGPDGGELMSVRATAASVIIQGRAGGPITLDPTTTDDELEATLEAML